MKRLLLIALAAGCLDEPSAPPGRTPELRAETLVADIDGDGKDDLVMWGHARERDPRHEADVMIRWGGQRPSDDADLILPISIEPDAKWHEILAVTLVTSARDASLRELLVVSGEDDAEPPAGIPSRRVYQTTFTFDARTPRNQTTSPDHVSKSNLGGYAGQETFAFVAAHDTTIGGQVHVLHGSDSVFFDHGLPLDVSTARFTEAKLTDRDSAEKVQGVYTLLPTIEGHTDLLVATDSRVAITSGDGPTYSFSAARALPSSTRRTTSARTFGTTATWLTGAPRDGTTLPLVRVAPANGFAIEYAELQAAGPPDQIALVQFLTHSDIDIVTLEGGELAAYENVSITTGAFSERVSADAGGRDILLVGHFVDGEDLILLFSRDNPTLAPLCFSGPMLTPC